MRVALFSDVHLGGPDDPHRAAFLARLAAIDADRLALLGDVFHHWWDFQGEPFPQYREVVAALRPWAGRLVFVPGNHDFRAVRFFAEELGAEVGPRIEARWDGLRVRLTHGDEVDESLGYAALSAVLRGRAFAAVMALAGPERGWRLLGRIAGGHPAAGASRPDPAPGGPLARRQIAEAERAIRDGFELVVSGHTHAPGVHRFEGGTYLNLGDWLHFRTWGWVEDGRVELRVG